MFDVKTAALLGVAVAGPTLLEMFRAPAYITGGQAAALASFGGGSSQSFAALVGDLSSPTGSQTADLAQRLLAAVDAGAAATSEPYALQEPLTGFAGLFSGDTWGQNAQVSASMPRSNLGDAYDTVKSMALFTPDDSDAADLAPELVGLAKAMDNQGYLVGGKPPTVTVIGGVAAAGAAGTKFVASLAAGALGDAAGAAFSALLTSPVLLGVAGLVAWRVLR